MHLLVLCVCLVLAAGAPPVAAPVNGGDLEAVTVPTTRNKVLQQEMQTAEYQDDEAEYEDTLTSVPVLLLLTPGELEGLLDYMQYRYGEELDLEEQRNQQEYDYQQWEDNEQEKQGSEGVVSRNKRQVTQQAMDLALSHNDRNGNNRPVGRIHGRMDVNGFYKDRNNHHTQGGIGLGSVLYRSNNGRHSVGIGAYGTQGRGRSYSYGYKTKPQWGAGIGYRFRF